MLKIIVIHFYIVIKRTEKTMVKDVYMSKQVNAYFYGSAFKR